MNRIVIVGAGECGARAAFALREKGYRRATITLDRRRTASALRAAAAVEGGVWLDSLEPKFVADAERYADCRDRRFSPIRRVDGHRSRSRKTVRLAERPAACSYDRLLLTTGARPRSLPGLSAASSIVIRMLRTHGGCRSPSAQSLAAGQACWPLSVAGLSAWNSQATARKLGADVVLLEGLPRMLTRGVPEEIAGRRCRAASSWKA